MAHCKDEEKQKKRVITHVAETSGKPFIELYETHFINKKLPDTTLCTNPYQSMPWQGGLGNKPVSLRTTKEERSWRKSNPQCCRWVQVDAF